MAECARCNRGLSDPVSIQRGFGPICWAKHQKELEKEEAVQQEIFNTAGGGIKHENE